MTSGPAHNPAPRDDPELLKEQIEQTRETVEEVGPIVTAGLRKPPRI
jgi:hypothetical protein